VNRRRTVATALLLLLLAACAAPRTYRFTVSGAVARTLSGGEVHLEDAAGGKQIYIQQSGPGEDIKVLIVPLPPAARAGSYAIADLGPGAAAYFEYVDGVSRRYDRAVRGTLSLTEAGDAFSGTIDVVAYAPLSEETVHIAGSFDGISRTGAAQGGVRPDVASAAAICGLGALVLLSFGCQFYVGQRVYAGQDMALLRSLRGTRTFIRGWRDPALRTVMAAWSILLVGLLLLLCLLGALAAGLR
jgi:hypothetical protein